MNLSHMPARRPRPFAAAAVLTAASALVAGCGGGNDTPSAQVPSSSPFSDVVTTSPSATPASSSPIVPSSSVPQHVTGDPAVPSAAQPKPPVDTSKENTLKPATPADKLIVKSHTGQNPKWRVAAQLRSDGVVCVTVTSLGSSTPAPDCQTGTQIALELLTGAGGGQGTANVAQIQRSVRNPPGDVLVSGATTGDVRTVYVEYRHKKYTADLSKHTVSLPVKLDLIKSLAGSSKGVPNPVTVKVFGLSLPEVNGNPPTTAELKGRRPKHGALTFELQ